MSAIDESRLLDEVANRRRQLGISYSMATPRMAGLATGIADAYPWYVLVELTGQTSNCTVIGDNPRVVAVDAGETARTTFEVVCGEVSRAALLFDGGSYADAGDAPAFDITTSWTIEACEPATLRCVPASRRSRTTPPWYAKRT